ncbi:MAG: addiction module protein [Nitrospirae bacterium]|nr:addiction module protein [Nitrospirota bacterium]MDA1304785.1 addiction module protein [Nitrospirota bacterium]
MKPDPQKLLEEALQYEPTTRAFIAETLLESLDFEEDFDLSQSWRDEIRQRCQEVDGGKVELIDSETVLTELRKQFPT